jgi:hypothetical protein
MKAKKQRRKIYDQNYYKAQAILRDPWFINKISWLKKRFEEIGCPVPKTGFKNLQQYDKWRNKYWDTRTKMYQDKEFITGVNKITNGKQKISSNEYDKLEEFKNDYLPPVYGAIFGDILEHFKIDRDNSKFRDFIERYIFLGYDEYPSTIIGTRWIRNSKTDKMELFIPILGHTKKEDIINNWDFISKEQKRLPDYLGKSKEWEEFDRDIEIYNLYKGIKINGPEKGFELKALDIEIYVQLHQKYKSLTVNKIRSIITKTAKRLGE